MSKKHSVMVVVPADAQQVNEYDSIIVDRDRELQQLVRLGQVEGGDCKPHPVTGALERKLCGQPAPLTGFASAMSARLQQRRADVTLRPATDEDCIALAETMRREDRDELAISCGLSPLSALRASLKRSSHAVTAVDGEGRVICMFGVGSVGFMSNTGSPWLLGSDLVEVHWRLFARLSHRYLAAMLDRYPWLSGLVDERRSQSIRYLEWLGFYVGTSGTCLNGRTFRAFNLRR